MVEAISWSCCRTFLVEGKAETWGRNEQSHVLTNVCIFYVDLASKEVQSATHLVLVINEEQDLSVILVHDRQHEGLEDRLRHSRGGDVTLLPKDGIKYMECGQACVLMEENRRKCHK